MKSLGVIMSSYISSAVTKQTRRILTAASKTSQMQTTVKEILYKQERNRINIISRIYRHPNKLYHTSTLLSRDKEQPKHAVNKYLEIHSIKGELLKEPFVSLCSIGDIAKSYRTHFQSGAVENKPETRKYGFFQALLIVSIFISVGAVLSNRGAKILHEYEIFSVTEEDDDLDYEY